MTNPDQVVFDSRNPNAGCTGITKREYFASAAQVAILQACCGGVTKDKTGEYLNDDLVAEESVRAADALIKALNKRKK